MMIIVKAVERAARSQTLYPEWIDFETPDADDDRRPSRVICGAPANLLYSEFQGVDPETAE
jgi:hypothetical protein